MLYEYVDRYMMLMAKAMNLFIKNPTKIFQFPAAPFDTVDKLVLMDQRSLHEIGVC